MAASLLLCAMILCSYYHAVAGDDHGFVVVPSSSFMPEDVCSTSRESRPLSSSRATVPLVHRHGPCAPSSRLSSEKPSFAETLRRSRARASDMVSKASSGGTGRVRMPASLDVGSLEYVVTVSLGTPAVPQVVVVDTGSDLSWVQCAPCGPGECHAQRGPFFDPRKSSSYAPVPCGSKECKVLTDDVYDNGCINGGRCGYAVRYADGTNTSGVYSSETLTLAPGAVVKGFHFGCGHHQGKRADVYDGILGLGGAPESLAAQTSAAYGGAFSYCLPAVRSGAGFLALGASSGGFSFTPMSRSPELRTFYKVTLAGISVGGKRLTIPASTLTGGMIVDSGSVITMLPYTANKALQSAFRAAMKAYPLRRGGQLDTCYNLTGHSNVAVPRVALTFAGGATVDLNVPNGILVDGCLAFDKSGPDGSTGVLGSVNQRTFEVLYDAARGRVGFRSGAC